MPRDKMLIPLAPQLVKGLLALQNPPALIPLATQLERAKNDFLAAEKLANVLHVSRRMEAGITVGGALGGGNAHGERRREYRST